MRMILKTGGTIAVSIGALVSAAGMNLAVLNQAPSGPGNLALAATVATTTTIGPRTVGPAPNTTAVATTTTTTGSQRPTTLGSATTSTSPAKAPTSSTTQPGAPQHPTTTTATTIPTTTTTAPPMGARSFVVRDAGTVYVGWVNARTLSATAHPKSNWTLPHRSKQGPDVTLRFERSGQLIVWHAWIEAHQIKAWIHTYTMPT